MQRDSYQKPPFNRLAVARSLISSGRGELVEVLSYVRQEDGTVVATARKKAFEGARHRAAYCLELAADQIRTHIGERLP